MYATSNDQPIYIQKNTTIKSCHSKYQVYTMSNNQPIYIQKKYRNQKQCAKCVPNTISCPSNMLKLQLPIHTINHYTSKKCTTTKAMFQVCTKHHHKPIQQTQVVYLAEIDPEVGDVDVKGEVWIDITIFLVVCSAEIDPEVWVVCSAKINLEVWTVPTLGLEC